MGLDSFYLLMYSVIIEKIDEERGPGILPGPLALSTSIGTVAKCFGAQLINLTRGPFSQVRVIYSKEELRILLIQ